MQRFSVLFLDSDSSLKRGKWIWEGVDVGGCSK